VRAGVNAGPEALLASLLSSGSGAGEALEAGAPSSKPSSSIPFCQIYSCQEPRIGYSRAVVQRAGKVVLIGCLALRLGASAADGDGPSADAASAPTGQTPKPAAFTQPKTLAELLALPAEELDKVDLAVMNLLCAEGLPGAEKLDVPQLLKTLDSWARWVGIITRQNRHRFVEDPQYFKNDEGDYRMAFLSASLQQTFGVRYNPERAEPQLKGGGRAEPEQVFFANSKDVFVHGLLTDNHYGTCASMPVLFAAVAQRLGYPVRLASTKGHLYVRYEEGDRHFNVEATSPGYSVYPDEHYKNWPVPISGEEIQEHHFLQPLGGRELLADFLSTRAVCLRAAGRLDQAREALAVACKLAPQVGWFKQMLEAYDGEITHQRNRAKWERLVADISTLELPEGDQFDYFRDKKIGLHFYLSQTGDLDGTEKALAALKSELATNRPARSALSSDLRPQPHATVQIVVMPEKARYTTIDGQQIDLLVRSPEELNSFLREQRLFDKVREIDNEFRRAKGLPADAPRPTSFNAPPGVSRDVALRTEEDRLDEIIRQQQEAKALARLAEANALSRSGLPPQMQATMDLVNNMNALNGQSRGPANPLAAFAPQMGLGSGAGIPGLPQDVQNALNLMNNMGGQGRGGVPGLPPSAQVGQPAMPALPKEVQTALDLKRQFDALSQLQPTNSIQNGKAPK